MTTILSMILVCIAFLWAAWLGEVLAAWLDPEEGESDDSKEH